MSGLYWREKTASIRDYAVTIKAGKASLTLKVQINDLDELPHIIHQIEEQVRAKKQRKPLMIEDMRGKP